MTAPLLIDISRLIFRTAKGQLPTGVDRVLLAYLEKWGSVSQALLQAGRWRRVLGFEDSQLLFSLLLERPADFNRRMNFAIFRACLPPWPKQHVCGAISLHLGQTKLEFPGFPEWVHGSGQRPIFFLHDLIPLTHPEFCSDGAMDAHALRLKRILALGAGVVCNSEDTLTAFAQFAKNHSLPLPKTIVAPLAPAELACYPASQPKMTEPYFVILGTIEPRKNHLLLLGVWRELVLRLGADAPKLVVIGQRGWECEQVVDILERCVSLKSHVLEVHSCSDEELASWLRHARALLFPSFAEGYGLPLVEALSLGTPVIASDLQVFKEIAGDVPDYLSPIDGEGWLRAVVDYSDPVNARREDQRHRMAGYRVPTWEDHFAAVQGLLEQLSVEGA